MAELVTKRVQVWEVLETAPIVGRPAEHFGTFDDEQEAMRRYQEVLQQRPDLRGAAVLGVRGRFVETVATLSSLKESPSEAPVPKMRRAGTDYEDKAQYAAETKDRVLR